MYLEPTSHCVQVKAAGGKVTREAGPVKGGKTIIAFVEDPTGMGCTLPPRKCQVWGVWVAWGSFWLLISHCLPTCLPVEGVGFLCKSCWSLRFT